MPAIVTPPVVMKRVCVVQTYWIAPTASTPGYYEITVAPDHDAKARRTVLVTRDIVLYEQAVRAEGWERRFDAFWVSGRSATGERVQVLTGLEASA